MSATNTVPVPAKYDEVAIKGIEPHILPRLDPEFLDYWVRVISKRPPPLDITVESIRKNPKPLQPQIAVDTSTGFARVKSYTLDTYDKETIPVRVYHPDPEEHGPGPYPVHLNYHGGGFVLGGLDDEAQICLSMREAGVVVIDVNYRHCPEILWGTFFEDAWSALIWARKEAKQLNILPDYVSIGGISAGGHITLVLQQRARDEGIPLRLAMPSVPPTEDLLAYEFYTDSPFPSFRDFYRGPILPWARVKFFQDLSIEQPREAGLEKIQKRWPTNYMSPLQATNWRGICDTFLRTGEMDMLRDEGEAYAHKLVGGGNRVTMKRYLGSVHTFMYMGKWLSRKREYDADSINALRAGHGLAPLAPKVVEAKVLKILNDVEEKRAKDEAAAGTAPTEAKGTVLY